MPRATLSPGQDARFSLYRRLDGLHNRYGRLEEAKTFFLPPRNRCPPRSLVTILIELHRLPILKSKTVIFSPSVHVKVYLSLTSLQSIMRLNATYSMGERP